MSANSRTAAAVKTKGAVAKATATKQAARVKGLRYYLDNKPGISRKKAGKAFAYYGADGRKITSARSSSAYGCWLFPPRGQMYGSARTRTRTCR